MLALYLLAQPPYTHRFLFLKANLEHIWHIADPLSLRISIICLRQEQGVIKIHNRIDHLLFLKLSSLEHSSLVPKLLFVFFLLFFYLSLSLSTLILEQYCHLLPWLFSKSGIWHVSQIVCVIMKKAQLAWHFCCGEAQSMSIVLMVKEGMAPGVCNYLK